MHPSEAKSSTPIADIFVGFSLLAFAFKDADGSLIQYILTSAGAQPLWYFPDALGFLCFFLFAFRYLEIALLLIPGWIFYASVGYQVTGSLASVGAGFKMLLPLFCGLLLTKSILNRSFVRLGLTALVIISCLGVFYSYFYTVPWSGNAFEAIDGAKIPKATVFMYGQVRTTGFNSDPHAAAFPILAMTALVLATRRSMMWVLLLLPISLVAIFITTSRSTLLAACVFIALLACMPREGSQSRSLILRASLMGSMLLFIIPIGLMFYFADVSSTSVPYELLSLYSRARESWIKPFEFMSVLSPLAYIHGYGLGGVGFPILKSNISSYFSPVDNFFIYSYLMFGVPYLFIYMIVARAALREHDQYKYILLTFTTLFGHFILGYGSTVFLVVYAYCINGLFRNFRRAQAPAHVAPPLAPFMHVERPARVPL